MSRARDLAEKTVNSVWLTAAQRLVTVLLGPLLVAALVAIPGIITVLQAEAARSKERIDAYAQRLTAVEGSVGTVRAELLLQGGNVVRLQAQRESDARVTTEIANLRDDIRELRARVDQILSPATRRVIP